MQLWLRLELRPSEPANGWDTRLEERTGTLLQLSKEVGSAQKKALDTFVGPDQSERKLKN
jgi:hypothetical protein